MVFFFQAEDGIRDAQESRGLGDVYKRQTYMCPNKVEVDTKTSATNFSKISYTQAAMWIGDHPVVAAAGQSTSSASQPQPEGTKVSQPTTEGMLYLVNADCVNAAYSLQDAGYNPIITNAGSRKHFGGGYANGARAQEELSLIHI
eukprot:TRINITY_DN33118_c0_g1_i1.p1 TRINITY_DN33118_c0_g1~~TRINITY_DN33118_c0_g1_i1.p1  ORF type:complete len:145 (-),score=27.94 TRINITY_DN33118_c0_g1_i1:108-542(-)